MRRSTRRLAAAAGLFACLGGAARAQVSDGVVRVGVLNDISGVFQDTNGPGSVMAARMAAEDLNGGGRGIRMEIVQGDHQNRADVGSALVRRWLDVDKVDAVADAPNSAVGLAISTLLRGSRAALLASSTATSDFAGSQCSPNTVQWVTDTWAIANSTAAGAMARGGRGDVIVDGALGSRPTSSMRLVALVWSTSPSRVVRDHVEHAFHDVAARHRAVPGVVRHHDILGADRGEGVVAEPSRQGVHSADLEGAAASVLNRRSSPLPPSSVSPRPLVSSRSSPPSPFPPKTLDT